ncbi:hypothetical protein B0H16DRAFT_1689301 [Mycena metata]|uniref:Uncharacterized protein n=1 Tax=Mycena metata TaxID=1033252 RepID=A0AAD7NF86_9AGAR|nr:hypothetical protein B0H16DRAFT_1689301 [Mycena metata]
MSTTAKVLKLIFVALPDTPDPVESSTSRRKGISIQYRKKKKESKGESDKRYRYPINKGPGSSRTSLPAIYHCSLSLSTSDVSTNRRKKKRERLMTRPGLESNELTRSINFPAMRLHGRQHAILNAIPGACFPPQHNPPGNRNNGRFKREPCYFFFRVGKKESLSHAARPKLESNELACSINGLIVRTKRSLFAPRPGLESNELTRNIKLATNIRNAECGAWNCFPPPPKT